MKLYTATRILQAQKEYLQDKKHLPKVNEEKLKEATEVVMKIVNFLNVHSVVGMCCGNPNETMCRIGEDRFKCRTCGKEHEI